MKPETKFKIKTYLYYLIIEPWTNKAYLPNLQTINWVLILIAAFLRNRLMLIVFIVLGIFFYLMNEFKSGKYIYWYRQRKFGEQREALKKIKLERRNNENGQKKMSEV